MTAGKLTTCTTPDSPPRKATKRDWNSALIWMAGWMVVIGVGWAIVAALPWEYFALYSSVLVWVVTMVWYASIPAEEVGLPLCIGATALMCGAITMTRLMPEISIPVILTALGMFLLSIALVNYWTDE